MKRPFRGSSGRATLKPAFGSLREERAAARKPVLEQELCQAVRDRHIVSLQYERGPYRSFAPHALYRSSKGKICVSGIQLYNPSEPEKVNEPHDFEVGKITGLEVTQRSFQPDARFDRNASKYSNGLICSV